MRAKKADSWRDVTDEWIPVAEPGSSKVTFRNPRPYKVVKVIKVDGCDIDDSTQKKCDYCVIYDDIMVSFVELKSGSIWRAAEQLIATYHAYDAANCAKYMF